MILCMKRAKPCIFQSAVVGPQKNDSLVKKKAKTLDEISEFFSVWVNDYPNG